MADDGAARGPPSSEELVLMASYLTLRQDRQLFEISNRADIIRMQSLLAEKAVVVGNVLVGVGDELSDSLILIVTQLGEGPLVRLLQERKYLPKRATLLEASRLEAAQGYGHVLQPDRHL